MDLITRLLDCCSNAIMCDVDSSLHLFSPCACPPSFFTLLGQSFKKGVDQDEARRRREETSISVRKTKKEDRLNKRRGGTLQLLHHPLPLLSLIP
jgi:hypothetical protein